MNLLAIAAGGALGAVARFILSGVISRLVGGAFPWGTLAVNVLGAFLMGAIVGWGVRVGGLSEALRLFLTTGVMGGFTTFSAFSLESVMLIERGDIGLAVLYAVASVLLTVLFLFLGLWLMRQGGV